MSETVMALYAVRSINFLKGCATRLLHVRV